MRNGIQKEFRFLKSSFIGILLLSNSTSLFANFDINKVRINLSLKQPVDTLRLKNITTDNKPISLQTTLMSWAQVDGKDKYTPSKDLIIAPPIMRIPPQRTQLLRVGWRTPSPLTQEKAYRLYIKDLSAFTPLNETGVQIRKRLGLPIFVAPSNPITRLNWATVSLQGNTLTMRASNNGNVHVQIIQAELKTNDQRTVGSYSGGIYVFPGQSQDIVFNMTDTASKNLSLKIDTDSTPIQTNINIP